jgi:hypothetical protein
VSIRCRRNFAACEPTAKFPLSTEVSVVHANEPCAMLGLFECLGDDHRDRLSIPVNRIVLKYWQIAAGEPAVHPQHIQQLAAAIQGSAGAAVSD